MKLHVQDDEQHTAEASPDPHLDELPGVGPNRRRDQDRPGHAHELFAPTSRNCRSRAMGTRFIRLDEHDRLLSLSLVLTPSLTLHRGWTV